MNQKMIDAVIDKFYVGRDEETHSGKFLGEPEEIIQAVINALWTDFDAEDENTYPKCRFAKNGQRWVIIDENGLLTRAIWESRAEQFLRGDTPSKIVKAVRYCDPADLRGDE